MQPSILFHFVRQTFLGCLLLGSLLFPVLLVAPTQAQEPVGGSQTPTPTVHSELCAPATPCVVGEQADQKPAGLQPAGPPALSAGPALPQETRSNGFTLAIAILIGMIAAVVYSIIRVLRGLGREETAGETSSSRWRELAVLLLALAGLGVAGYLTFIENQGIAAVCGPVGDCNSVQSSPYAYLFGVLPVGLLGLIGYLGILGAWIVGERLYPRWKAFAWLAIFGMALFGTAFSIYLTYLEPFVINAVCIWCLSSAVIITLILVLSAGRAGDFLAIEEEPIAETGFE